MRMNEDCVSHSLAVALKAAGFDWHCRAAWHYEGSEWNFIKDYASTFQHPKEIPDWNSASWDTPYIVSAPTLAMAQKWLREKQKIDVLVWNCACGYGWEISKADADSRGTTLMDYDDNGEDRDSGMWLTYENALSAGINVALQLLDNEK